MTNIDPLGCIVFDIMGYLARIFISITQLNFTVLIGVSGSMYQTIFGTV